ncbi:helix-turn-helix transcriptional regulator [Paenibacillus tritici]|uniref:Helix-turn-helix transcriptional regulator n=1 Tax=Paenibacillus tritici TaxID=1873425 RepID=A0ABX2DHP0_9BACL|nr:PadR family transcriptional regulator [Paenibacillus tritici]NQX44128.1 helix-turn-helix transcriptional regulator [Paenibacillus tritici]QUL57762.1 helix-turn-helix transcriptional regulator [Paenibacillus tritici]
MKVSKEMLKGSTGTLILTLLLDKPLYGYELIKELEQRSQGVFSLKEGTLYPILHAMESERWVEAYWMEVDGRKRKYYRLLEEGKHKLQEKKAEWKLFKGAVDTVLGEGNA